MSAEEETKPVRHLASATPRVGRNLAAAALFFSPRSRRNARDLLRVPAARADARCLPRVSQQTEEKKEETPAAPIFGFGAAGGFGAAATFDPSAFASAPKAAAEGGDDDDDAAAAAAAEAECKAEFVPVVKLEQVETASGEENEDVLFEAKSKAYRFTEGEWKERGLGPIKLLQDKDSKKIRVLMRREKTLKVCANFFVKPGTKVEEHAGSEKARVFTTMDCSDGDIRPVMVNMCVKFGSAEKAQTFQDEFEKAMEVMKQFEGEESEEKKDGDAAADALADKVAEAKVGEEEKKEEA